MTTQEARATVEDAARTLIDYYLFPETGLAYAEALRAKAAAGGYDGTADPEAFGAAVTADLQAVSPDAHVKVYLRRTAAPQADAQTADAQTADNPPALAEAKTLDGNIRYLRIDQMSDDPADLSAIAAALDAVENPRALIVDLRANRGGGLGVTDAVYARLGGVPRRLVVMEVRADAYPLLEEFFQLPTLRPAGGPETVRRFEHWAAPKAGGALEGVPVYVLVSPKTASAAEHFAFAMKLSGDGTIVGEPTRGGAHFGGPQEIGERFEIWTPIGRTYDPATGKDWEGVGVAPDIAVPADEALEAALARIGG